MKDLSNEIRAYALKNAIDFGKVETGRILPKLFQHGLDKKDIKTIMPVIQKIVGEVNKLSAEKRTSEFESYSQYVKEHEEQRTGLAELPEISSKMVFRLAPFPSGALHLGNAKTYLLNALYAEKYKAKTILIMDDTIGSEEKQIAPEAYSLIEEAFKWLGVQYDKKIVYKSDRLELYYEYAEKLLSKDAAYVCHCPALTLRENRAKGIACECRGLSKKEQQQRWKEMFKAKEGSAVLRLKTDIAHPNPAFRDRVLFKISDRTHPRVKNKYRVWPTLEMSWAIDDHDLGITHILRGNDLAIESDMEKFIWDLFGWKHPVIIHTGLVNIEGMGAKLSKSKAQAEVRSGEFSGWDDPRTWSIQSLRRRGISATALRTFVESIGLNRNDITTPVESLYAINRKLIDATADRYYFVKDPVSIEIKNAPSVLEVEVPLHPDRPTEVKVMRVTPGSLSISGEDFKTHKGKEVRLLHLYNIKLDKKATYTTTENKPLPKLQWVSFGTDVKILMPDGNWISGSADENVADLKVDNIIQFERFGFCRVDKTDKEEIEFWFAHL